MIRVTRITIYCDEQFATDDEVEKFRTDLKTALGLTKTEKTYFLKEDSTNVLLKTQAN
jgi:hypothetical protein